MIAGEIDRLAPTDRTILRYAAVLGTSFEPDLLVGAVREDVDIDAEVWSRLGDSSTRSRGATLRFRNTLIRDAAYEGLPYRRRRDLHARVGETIEARAGVSLDEEVAGRSRSTTSRRSAGTRRGRSAGKAGDRAMSIYAIADASRFYGMALSAGRRSRTAHAPELADLYGRWSDALYVLGQYDHAEAALQAARRLVKLDPIQAAPIAIKQAIIATRVGKFRAASQRTLRALKPLLALRGREAAAARARLMVIQSGTRYFQNRRAESIRWARSAEREARRAHAKDALADAYKLLDLALKESGKIDQAIYSERALGSTRSSTTFEARASS